jgi:hemolysin III
VGRDVSPAHEAGSPTENALRRALRDPFSALSHLVAATAALAGTVALLVVTEGGPARQLPMLIYGASLAGLFSASAFYHMPHGPATLVARLRKLDHAAIFLLIAGTYTPTSWLFLDGTWRAATLIGVWALALAGILYKVFWIGARRWLYTAMYVLMGWMGLALIGQLQGRLPAGALSWLIAGGVVYTVGAVLYVLKWPRLWPQVFGFHDSWHLFVVAAAGCHYVAHLLYLAPLPG